jgi:hypothetical protein
MRQKFLTLSASFLLLAAALVDARPTVSHVVPAEPSVVEPALQPSVDADGLFSVKKAQRGVAFQGAVVLNIPGGYHINSNRPTNKFMIPTSVRVTGPRGVRIGRVQYPRAIVRSFEFAPDERLPVFEGRPAVRFTVTVPDTFKDDRVRLRAVVSYQACSNEACYRPDTRDITFTIKLADEGEDVERANNHIFGGRGRRR